MNGVDSCFICGTLGWLETHHIFGGALRDKSDKYNLTIKLCHYCHNKPPSGVHHNKKAMKYLHEYGQQKAMRENNWTIEDFRREFYKNYL